MLHQKRPTLNPIEELEVLKNAFLSPESCVSLLGARPRLVHVSVNWSTCVKAVYLFCKELDALSPSETKSGRPSLALLETVHPAAGRGATP